ncbi:vacuolar ATPase V1 domain subunit H [Scheffersomyces xylosifermentans]|uniref:vacuolar ATPase V1 domain subunit H n=1 Tax=Scheffersomyces xylosifermentans TaxID=1304137 RepID=UPI00315CB569
MATEFTPLVIDSGFLSDSKKIIRDRIIPWEGLSRSGVVSEDDASYIKVLEKQSPENKKSTVLSQLDLCTNTILNLLNKLEVNEKDDVLKNVLTLINDLLLELPGQEFLDSLLALSDVDSSLPYVPFLKHLDNNDGLIKSLALYNLIILLSKASKNPKSAAKIDKEVLIKIFDVLSSEQFIGNVSESNFQLISIQLLQELLIVKQFKQIYQDSNLVSNFKSINQLISNSAKYPNATGLQLSYNILLSLWILSFSAPINKTLVHNFPELINNLLVIAKDSIMVKIVRVSVGILKNFVSVTSSSQEQFKTIKILLFHEGLPTINILKGRKFASNESDEELANDLVYLSDVLNEIVAEKLTSFDEYLTELENPNLLSFSSPTHKSTEFWLENSHKFKDSSYKLVKRILEILASPDFDTATIKVILLNDLQFLIKNLGNDLVNVISTEKDGAYKLLIMSYLDNNKGDNDLKYEALKTIQLLVGRSF